MEHVKVLLPSSIERGNVAVDADEWFVELTRNGGSSGCVL
jgi:hypothetical protein